MKIFTSVWEIEIFIAPFFELWIIFLVMFVAGVLQGFVEMSSILNIDILPHAQQLSKSTYI
jgi:hypothetical protein